jgi:hypothetical protein
MGNIKGALEDLEKAAQLLEASEKDGLAAHMRQQGGDDGRGTAADCYSGVLIVKTVSQQNRAKLIDRGQRCVFVSGG